MSRSVLLVDTTMGNLRSVARALSREGAEVTVSGDPDAVRAASRVVVPGQGAFGDFVRALEGGLGAALLEHLTAGRPYLGVCLGMQILFESSEEAEGARGLGVFPGRVERIETAPPLKVPHMGWNEVESTHAMLPPREWFYFVHSYACVPRDPACVVGHFGYGGPRVAAVARDGLLGVQFHPEKSQDAGAAVLRAFLDDRWT